MVLAGNPLDGLSWPSVSFAILVGSLLLSFYVLWRRFRSRRQLIRRVTELETLSAAGRAIVTSELDVVALCELIAEASGKVIDNNTFQIGLFEPGRYKLLYGSLNGQRQETLRSYPLNADNEILSWIKQEKHPLLVSDFTRERAMLPQLPSFVDIDQLRSAIFIPLISGEQTIGIMLAQSDEPFRFDEEDLRRLMILANQSAAAIAHALLYEQARNRAAHLELVGRIARQIGSVQSQEEIFSHVVGLIRETFGFHPVLILGVDPGVGDLVVKASSFRQLLGRDLRLPMGSGFAGNCASSRETIVSNNVAGDARFLHQMPGQPDTAVETRAEMAIPLIFNDEVLGVLDVQSTQEGVFGSAEITALEALAAEVAIALDKARQLEQQREQAWLTTAQLQVAKAIGHNEDLDSIIGTIARLTTMLVGAATCGIFVWDDENEVYRGAKLFGVDQREAKAFNQLRYSVGDWPPLDAAHVGQEPFTTGKRAPWLPALPSENVSDQIGVELVPLRNNVRVQGMMALSGLGANPDQGEAAAQLHQDLLRNIAQQTALAIESSRLRRAQQEEAWVNTALLQVAEAVNNLIDLNEILDTIVRLVPMLVGVRVALVLIWDEEREAYRAGPSHGISELGRGLLENEGLHRDEFLAIRADSVDFLSPSASYYSLRLPPWLVKILGTPIAHAFPLNARGRVVGVMMVGTSPEEGRAFSSRRLNILNGIAHQAATAVVNNQLYRESAERNRLEQELSVARGIQESLIPSGSPDITGCSVSSFWQAARQVSGDFYDFLAFPDGRWGIVIADVADKGIAAALFMALSRTILRTVAFSRADPADVLIRTNQIINQDTQSDLFVTVFYAIWDPSTGNLAFANGGHNPPLLMRKDGRTHTLRGRGMALGVLPDIHIEQRIMKIGPGDVVLFYTDGVTEAMNEDYDEFGLDRLLMAAAAAGRNDANGIVSGITAAIGDHAGDTAQSDDITLVVMKRRG